MYFYRAACEKVPIPKEIAPDLFHDIDLTTETTCKKANKAKVTLPVHPGFFLPPPHWMEIAWEKDECILEGFLNANDPECA